VKLYLVQPVAAAECNRSHETVFRSASSLSRRPPRTHDVGRLAIDAIGRIHSKLSIHDLVDAGWTHMRVELGDFRADVTANQEVGRNRVPGGVP
jgi:hypothetical protein